MSRIIEAKREDLARIFEEPYLQADLRNWELMMFHHSYRPRLSDLEIPEDGFKHAAKSIDRYHRFTRGWKNGLGYHFVVEGDGIVSVGPRWIYQKVGAHCKEDHMNVRAIGICMVGDFGGKWDEKEKWDHPTVAQILSLLALSAALVERFNISLKEECFLYHSERAHYKSCPGFLITTLNKGWRKAFISEVSYILDKKIPFGDLSLELLMEHHFPVSFKFF
jgi:hypothetical protein